MFLSFKYVSILNIENTCIFLQIIQDLFPRMCLNVHVTDRAEKRLRMSLIRAGKPENI